MLSYCILIHTTYRCVRFFPFVFSLVRGKVQCISDIATAECGEPLTMHLAAQYAVHEMLSNEQYNSFNCTGESFMLEKI